MTDDSTILSQMEELDLPEDTERARVRRAGRPKVAGIPRGATRSPNFNALPRPQRRVSADERDALGRVVRQPPILEAFQKPLKPITLARNKESC